jgi:predicted ATP-grasp superfamily ATP-dependent carboligase
LLLVGNSVRALAESAAQAGYGVMAIDAYCDLDLRAVALALARCAPFAPRVAVRLARAAACDTVVYSAPFENDPRAIAALARPARRGRRGTRRRALWGNSPATVRRVRDPVRLAAALTERGFAVPALRATLPRAGSAAAQQMTTDAWLLKPLASGGGQGVRLWQPGERIPPGFVLQQRIRGVSGSIVFAADGRRVVPLALTRQLVGDRRVGGSGYRYCGNILVPPGDSMLPRDAEVLARATAIATAVTRDFGLVGVNGIDFIARAGVPYPIEVNPRPTGAAELAERAYGISIFTIHARAVAGTLPVFDLARERAAAPAVGKTIVFARRATPVRDTTQWLTDRTVRDIPASGSIVQRGQPICTVFAEAKTGAACLDRLVARARRLAR